LLAKNEVCSVKSTNKVRTAYQNYLILNDYLIIYVTYTILLDKSACSY